MKKQLKRDETSGSSTTENKPLLQQSSRLIREPQTTKNDRRGLKNQEFSKKIAYEEITDTNNMTFGGDKKHNVRISSDNIIKT